jgi:protein involved in polysaccharide export with SLBB domain
MHSLKIPRVWLVATVLPSALFFSQALSAQETSQPTSPPDYRIHIGDVFQISVYQHPELSRRVVVDGGGNRIVTAEGVKASALPAIDKLLFDLQVAGLTTMDVTKLIHAKLESKIPAPQVTVTVVQRTVWPATPSPLPSPQLRDTPAEPQHGRDLRES